MRVFVLPLLLGAFIFGTSCTQKAGLETDRVGRIERIENGLLPGMVVKGQSSEMKLAERMAHYKVPGVSIAVIDKGELTWAKGYGVMEAGGTSPVTVETRFQAASISKPVAAMAALALAEEGRLGLDENVNLKLRSWQVPENRFTKDQKVTLRGLLGHSAGLTVNGFRGYATGESVPTLVQILDGQRPAHSDPIRVDILPGSQWRYSGGGYTVLQQMMVDVTGKPFPELMQEVVLSKIGMSYSAYGQPLPKDWEGLASSGHDENGKSIKGRRYTYPEMAAAGLWTTPSDLARFAIELQQSLNGQSNKVLPAEMTRQMLTKQLGGWGLGIGLGGEDRVTTFSHGGSNVGFQCILFAYLETGQGAVVMTNGDNGGSLFNEILRAIAREYGWADYQPKMMAQVNPALYQAYVGSYDASGTAVTISADAEQLYVLSEPLGRQRVKLYPSAEDRFFVPEGTLEVIFVKDAQGNVTELRAESGGNTVTAKKVK